MMCVYFQLSSNASPFSKYSCTNLHSNRVFEFPLLHSFSYFFVSSDFKISTHHEWLRMFAWKRKPAPHCQVSSQSGHSLRKGRALASKSNDWREIERPEAAPRKPEAVQFPVEAAILPWDSRSGAAECCPPLPRTRARAETWPWNLTAPWALCSCAFRPTLSTEGKARRAAAFSFFLHIPA